MTTILLDLSNRPELKIIARLASDLTVEAGDAGIPIFMAGAMARDLILSFGYQINTGRRTEDVDWAIMVQGWEEFETLKLRLVRTGRFTVTPASHRIKFNEIIPVDLIPFGAIADSQGMIAWPDDHQVVMSVLGFDDAYRDCIEVRLPGMINVKVASLPGLALLKILAWKDRHLTFPSKDAHDFTLIARHYIDAGNQDRLYEEFAHLVSDLAFDFELASARMLGHDIARAFSPQPMAAARRVLRTEADANGSLSFVAAMPCEPIRALRLLENVLLGLG